MFRAPNQNKTTIRGTLKLESPSLHALDSGGFYRPPSFSEECSNIAEDWVSKSSL